MSPHHWSSVCVCVCVCVVWGWGVSYFWSSCVLLVKEHHFMSHYPLAASASWGMLCVCVYMPVGFHCFYTARPCPTSQKKQVRYKIRGVER